MLRFNDVLIYWSVQILNLQVLGKEEEKSSCSTDPWDAPGPGDGLSSVDTQEPCEASPFLSGRVGGE